MYILPSKGVNTNKVYFNPLGFYLQGKKCFSIWSDSNPKKELFTASETFIKNNLIKI